MIYLNVGFNTKEISLPKIAQMSSIEDIYIDQKGDITEIYSVGNFLGYTTELGQSSAKSGSILSINNKLEWQFSKDLPLPINLNARKIIKIDKEHFLIIANNDKSYIFTIPNK